MQKKPNKRSIRIGRFCSTREHAFDSHSKGTLCPLRNSNERGKYTPGSVQGAVRKEGERGTTKKWERMSHRKKLL